MSNANNGKRCLNCKQEWYFFDRCCGSPKFEDAPMMEKFIEKMADKALEHDHIHGRNEGRGFLEKPYDRYRYHNGYTEGFRKGLEVGRLEERVMVYWGMKTYIDDIETQKLCSKLEAAARQELAKILGEV